MSALFKVSKYSLGLIVFYLLVTPFFFIYAGDNFSYGYLNEDLRSILFITLGTLAFFFLFLRNDLKVQSHKISSWLYAFSYGLVFAIPEEIIFRGLIQGSAESYFSSDALAIFIASLVFGLAHLPNNMGVLMGWNWKLTAITFFAGIPLGTLFAVTGSLLSPTILHALLVVFLKLFVQNPALK